jgi:general secretion pathway protein L
MPNTLFIRPVSPGDNKPASEKHYEWALFDVAGSLLKYGTRSTLDIIDQTLMQNAIEHVEIIGLLPAQAALCTQVSVPGNQSRYIQQALPFAVEDQIAQDIDAMHLVLGEKIKSGEYSVTCITHTVFSDLYDALNDEDLVGVLKAIHLDSHLLPLEDHFLKIVLSASEAMIIQASGQVITVKFPNIIPYLDSLFLTAVEDSDASGQEDQRSIDIVMDKTVSDDSRILIAEIQQYPHVTVSTHAIDTSAFEFICAAYFNRKAPPLNLCQGTYQLSSRSQGAWFRWRAVALIAGLGFLLQLGVFVGQGIYLEKQAQMLANEALNQYQSAVPGVKNISVDKLPRIIKGQLNQLSSRGVAQLGFLDLLGEAGYQYNVSPNKSALVFSSINYSAQRGELLLEMHARSFEQLELLKKSIVDAGLTAKISSAVQEKDYFKGRISVGGA